jgi:hypothetical protein
MNIRGRWSKSASGMSLGDLLCYIHHDLFVQGSVIKSFCIPIHKQISEV